MMVVMTVSQQALEIAKAYGSDMAMLLGQAHLPMKMVHQWDKIVDAGAKWILNNWTPQYIAHVYSLIRWQALVLDRVWYLPRLK